MSRPTSLSGAKTRLGIPMRSRKSRIARVSASGAGVTMRTVSTSGAATVDPQSESISHTAVWNSSSRTPRGISRKASYLPLASPVRRFGASVRKTDQWAAMRRRAVGTTDRHRPKAARTFASGRRDSATNIATWPPREATSAATCSASSVLPA